MLTSNGHSPEPNQFPGAQNLAQPGQREHQEGGDEDDRVGHGQDQQVPVDHVAAHRLVREDQDGHEVGAQTQADEEQRDATCTTKQ